MVKKKRHYDQLDKASYSGELARRTQEMQDAGMIREDRAKVANLPQDVHYKPWPSGGYYLSADLDDTIRGINDQMNDDGSQAAKHHAFNKY